MCVCGVDVRAIRVVCAWGVGVRRMCVYMYVHGAWTLIDVFVAFVSFCLCVFFAFPFVCFFLYVFVCFLSFYFSFLALVCSGQGVSSFFVRTRDGVFIWRFS